MPVHLPLRGKEEARGSPGHPPRSGSPRLDPVPSSTAGPRSTTRGSAGRPSGPGRARDSARAAARWISPRPWICARRALGVRGVRPARRPGDSGVARSVVRPSDAGRPRRAVQPRFSPHAALLAGLDLAEPLPGAMARDGQAFLPGAEAHTFTHGGHHRGAHDEPARKDRRPAQLGLPIHLGAGCRLHRLRLPARGLYGRSPPLIEFLERRFRDLGGDASLQVLYGVDGRTELPETILEHLEDTRAPARCAPATTPLASSSWTSWAI